MKKLVSVMASLVFSSQAFAFTGDNDPKFIVKNYNDHFKSLALKAKLSSQKTPWASSFWPNIYGGIAFRWNGYYADAPMVRKYQHIIGDLKDEVTDLKKELFSAQIPSDAKVARLSSKINQTKVRIKQYIRLKGDQHQKYFYDLKRPTSLEQVRSMTQQQRDQLSPAEKYDVYVALKTGKDLDLYLTNKVLDSAGPYEAYWEGICHGWSSASIEFNEPQVQSYSNNGITINFASSDLKALLSYYHAAITKNPAANRKVVTGRVGERCETQFPEESWFIKNGKEYYRTVENGHIEIKPVPQNCVDTNPGAFHIVLANQIAIKKQGFVAEAVRDKEVWNQPVFAYDTKIISETNRVDAYATPKTKKQVRVKTKMYYGNDGGRMFWDQDEAEEEFYAWWNPTNGTANYRSAHKVFEYILDLDRRGRIIGGRWLSYDRPDFVWLKKNKGFITRGWFLGQVGYMKDLQDFVTIR